MGLSCHLIGLPSKKVMPAHDLCYELPVIIIRQELVLRVSPSLLGSEALKRRR